jgi:hypothetical protein
MINLPPEDVYSKVEYYAEPLLSVSVQEKKKQAFKVFMDKMNATEKSVQELGYYSEEEVEKELSKI